MNKHEYIEACHERCKQCGRLKYNRSPITNRLCVQCKKGDRHGTFYYFESTDWIGIEEFFMHESNWKDFCSYADERIMMMVNTDEFVHPSDGRKMRI